MELTVRRALELKGQMKSALTSAEQSLSRARVSNTFEVAPDGVESETTDKGIPTLTDALVEWRKINLRYMELECMILRHNSENEVTYWVRHRKIHERMLKVFEAALPKLVERKVRAGNYLTTDNSVRFLIERPLYDKATLKTMIKDCKREMRLAQEKIDLADTKLISVSFEYDDLD